MLGLSPTSPQHEAGIRIDPPRSLPSASATIPDATADVRQSIARIKASPFIPLRDNVRGFVYDVTTGTLHEVGAGDRELSGSTSGATGGSAR